MAPGFEAAHGFRQRQERFPGAACGVLFDADKAEKAAAVEITRTHRGAEGAWRDHADIDEWRRLNEAKGDIVTVGEDQQMSALQIGRNELQIHFGRDLVGQHEQQDMTPHNCRADIHRREAVLPGMLAGFVFAQPDHQTNARIAQVTGDRSAQVAIADDADGFAAQRAQVSVAIVVNGCHGAALHRASRAFIIGKSGPLRPKPKFS